MSELIKGLFLNELVTWKSDNVGFFGDAGAKYFVAGSHDAEVDDPVVVAAQNDANDVLPDIVDVALHRRQNDRSGVSRLDYIQFCKKVNQFHKI